MHSVTKRRPRNWPGPRITKALRDVGLTHTELAKRLGRGRSSVSLVIAGLTKSAYIAGAIAEALGTTPDVIWPRLYLPADPAAGAGLPPEGAG